MNLLFKEKKERRAGAPIILVTCVIVYIGVPLDSRYVIDHAE